ncbi:MAG: cupin domain-containing protein [Solirubrobacteraceae bacterium]
MAEQPYFDQSGEASDAPPRFVHVEDLDPLIVIPGLEFRPVTTETVMTNFVNFEPDAVAPAHHHDEQQIAIIFSGELTITVGAETRVMRAGDCVVIPPNVEHGVVAGPQGCQALDVFTPPRAGIVRLMAD